MNKKLFALLVLSLFIVSGCSLSALTNNIKQTSDSIGSNLASNHRIIFQEITTVKGLSDFASQANDFAIANWSPDAELKSIKFIKDDSVFAYRAEFQSVSQAAKSGNVAIMIVYYNFSTSFLNLDPQNAPYYEKSSVENNGVIAGVYDVKDEGARIDSANIESGKIKVSVSEIANLYKNVAANDRCQEGDLLFVSNKLEFDWGKYRFDAYGGTEILGDKTVAPADSAASATKSATPKLNSSVDLNKDSDNDGLPDADEARYGTNPNNPDTDGDGFQDGQEIKDGFNPLGPGKMTEAQLKIKNK